MFPISTRSSPVRNQSWHHLKKRETWLVMNNCCSKTLHIWQIGAEILFISHTSNIKFISDTVETSCLTLALQFSTISWPSFILQCSSICIYQRINHSKGTILILQTNRLPPVILNILLSTKQCPNYYGPRLIKHVIIYQEREFRSVWYEIVTIMLGIFKFYVGIPHDILFSNYKTNQCLEENEIERYALALYNNM